MTGSALVCKLGEHIAIEGADRIVRVDMFGETVITSVNCKPGTMGLLFDCESQLSAEFLSEHNLYRDNQLNKDKSKSGYFRSERIRCERFKGVKTSAFFMSFDELLPKWKNENWQAGEQITEVNGKYLCSKWINPNVLRAANGNRAGRLAKKNLVPTFAEHFDTDQLERNWDKISLVPAVISRKNHGASCRAGNLPIIQPPTFLQKILSYVGVQPKQETKFGLVVGSRHVTKYIEGANSHNTDKDKQSYYNEDIWTKSAKENFEGKLNKGEVVYYEIVGYLPSGEAIMPGRETKALEKFLDKDEYKKWKNHYGDKLDFSYGCEVGSYDIYVYRITSVNPDGTSIDYSWEQVKSRCDQLSVKYVPELEIVYPQAGESLRDYRDRIASTVKSHHGFCQKFPLTPNEGICLRQESGSFTPRVFKSKTFEFKVLEGIIKETSVDLEESN